MTPLALLIPMLADALVTQWDSPWIVVGKLAVIVALVGLNGFFVACEFAIIKVRASQLDELAEEGNPPGAFCEIYSLASRCLSFGDPTRRDRGQSGVGLAR